MDDQWAHICWRGAVSSAIRGKRGQAFLKEMLAAMDAMPQKRLIVNSLEVEGEVCALGAVGKVRGVTMDGIDPENYENIADAFGIAEAMAREIMFMNDECGWMGGPESPEARFRRMREWIAAQIITDGAT